MFFLSGTQLYWNFVGRPYTHQIPLHWNYKKLFHPAGKIRIHMQLKYKPYTETANSAIHVYEHQLLSIATFQQRNSFSHHVKYMVTSLTGYITDTTYTFAISENSFVERLQQGVQGGSQENGIIKGIIWMVKIIATRYFGIGNKTINVILGNRPLLSITPSLERYLDWAFSIHYVRDHSLKSQTRGVDPGSEKTLIVYWLRRVCL